MDWLATLPDTFTLGLVAGLALGLMARFAAKLLASAVVIFAIVELLVQAGAL